MSVILHTNHGSITLELDASRAPKTVANFLAYVRSGHFDNTLFHRVIDGFMIQGGGFARDFTQKPVGAPIANEATNALKNAHYTFAMAPTLFVSDLHLSPARPHLVAAFHEFVAGPARSANALYVLGDLFDVWLGDDQLREPLASAVAGALSELPGLGVPVYLQCGNRDFLLGERFAQACRSTLLPDTAVHDVQGTPTLLMHGDLLCTDDVEYQRFRAYWKDPTRRHRLLARPYFVRRVIATGMR